MGFANLLFKKPTMIHTNVRCLFLFYSLLGTLLRLQAQSTASSEFYVDDFCKASEGKGYGVLILERPTDSEFIQKGWQRVNEKKVVDSLVYHTGIMHVDYGFYENIAFSRPSSTSNPYPRLVSRMCEEANIDLSAKNYLFLYVSKPELVNYLKKSLNRIQFDLEGVCDNYYQLVTKEGGCVFDKEENKMRLFQRLKDGADYNASLLAFEAKMTSQNQTEDMKRYDLVLRTLQDSIAVLSNRISNPSSFRTTSPELGSHFSVEYAFYRSGRDNLDNYSFDEATGSSSSELSSVFATVHQDLVLIESVDVTLGACLGLGVSQLSSRNEVLGSVYRYEGLDAQGTQVGKNVYINDYAEVFEAYISTIQVGGYASRTFGAFDLGLFANAGVNITGPLYGHVIQGRYSMGGNYQVINDEVMNVPELGFVSDEVFSEENFQLSDRRLSGTLNVSIDVAYSINEHIRLFVSGGLVVLSDLIDEDVELFESSWEASSIQSINMLKENRSISMLGVGFGFRVDL